MTSLITRASAITRSQDSSVSLVFDPTTGTWSGVMFMRTLKGVFFLESPLGSKRPDLNTAFFHAFMRGRYSKRPHLLGEPIDASLDNCVLALFYDLCEACDLKAHGIARLAYPEGAQMFTASDFSEIVGQASWENYSVPNQWDAASVMMLYKALDDAGYSRMRSVLEAILRLPSP
jgi:hypothetical protein